MSEVLTGSTVWAREGFKKLDGLKIGFVANHTARLNDGTPTLTALLNAGVDIGALFAPEHGAFGALDDTVPDEIEPSTGLPIYSLYGPNKKPPADRLAGLDALVLELQDVGARFYTYSSTLGHCLEGASEAGIPVYILDRPNPITGNHCEGPLADPDRLSFVAFHTAPIRHGLTLGELGRLLCAERSWGETAQVATCEGWRRDMWFDQTGIPWVDPSPAMRSLDAAILYPGVCLLEQTNVSVGRGTDIPFLRAGAPFIDANRWVHSLRQHDIDGVSFSEARFTPALSKYNGEECTGIEIAIDDRESLDSVRLGVSLAATLRDLYGEKFEMQGIERLLVNREAFALLSSGADAGEICASWQADLAEWQARRRPHLLYD